jgi:TRAP-type C4-dicarboxylate transport system permease small subunit
MFEKLKGIIQKATRALAYIGMALVLPMMLLTSADAVARDFWSRPIPGAFELSSYMLSIFVLLGLAYAQQTKDHVRATMLVSRLPEKVAASIAIVTTLLCMFIVAILFWQGIVVACETQSVSDMLRISQFPFRLLVSVGALFLFLEFGFDLVESARKLVS